MIYPSMSVAAKLQPGGNRVFVGACGFEQRSLGWTIHQRQQGCILNSALIFRYRHPKGRNRIRELREGLAKIGVTSPIEIPYDASFPEKIEGNVFRGLGAFFPKTDEIIVDISAMTKLLTLVCLCKLCDFSGTVRIVYSEAEEYAPTIDDYEKSKEEMEMITRFPSHGFESVITTKCLSSVRMQGQPMTMVAFTSFNEQLVRHMLGSINPHRLLFINGRPPRADFSWRERATQEIHKGLMEEYPVGNSFDEKGLLVRVASTLVYSETIEKIEEIYRQFGTHERIIVAATGSKMQTVGLFFSKMAHPDIHIEYPTPDSYFVKGMSMGVRKVHEIVIPRYAEFLKSLH